VFISAIVLLFVAVYAIRGWQRGLVVEVIELAGIVGGVAAAYVAWPTIERNFEGWTAALGGAAVFGVVLIAALVAAGWARRHTAQLPQVPAALHGVGGLVIATTWSVLLATAMLVLSISAPGARAQLAEPVCDAPVARALISDANPLHDPGERIAVIGRPVLLWLSQQLTETLALSHASLCDDLPETDPERPEAAPDPSHFTFPEAGEDELEVDPEAERAVFDLMNQARVDAGLDPLAWDDQLRDVGRRHSLDMYVRGYLAHETPECRREGPDAEGCTDPFDRMRAGGVSYDVAGENLALAPSPEQAHDGLMRSPGHRRNILNPDFTTGGIGVYRGPHGLMVTQLFTG
jgi:uncharacterized protein YkwD